MERSLFVAQRLSAMILGPLVMVHLGLILYAVRGGLTGAEILARTQGSIGWGIFYCVFVVSVSIHAPLGIRNVLIEWTGLTKTFINLVSIAIGFLFLILGLRAVVAVV